MSTATSPRLSPESWLDAGLLALAEDGPEALRAEPLSRRIGTSKGSFYWHFPDVPGFHTALLTRWHDQALAQLSATNSPDMPAATQLRHLLEHLACDNKFTPAIRAWARSHASAAKMLSTVETHQRISLQTHLKNMGISNPDMTHALHAAATGLSQQQETDTAKQVIGSLLDLVLALR